MMRLLLAVCLAAFCSTAIGGGVSDGTGYGIADGVIGSEVVQPGPGGSGGSIPSGGLTVGGTNVILDVVDGGTMGAVGIVSVSSGGVVTITFPSGGGGDTSSWSTNPAVSDLDMASNRVYGIKGITFTNLSGAAVAEWDEEFNTLGIHNGAFLYHSGQDLLWYVNNTNASTISKGTIVFASGIGIDHLEVSPYIADGSIPARFVLGIAANDMAQGQFGGALAFGVIDGIDLNGFSLSDVLYPSPTVAGAFTNVAPPAGSISLPLGFVMATGATGRVAIRVTPIDENGFSWASLIGGGSNSVDRISIDQGFDLDGEYITQVKTNLVAADVSDFDAGVTAALASDGLVYSENVGGADGVMNSTVPFIWDSIGATNDFRGTTDDGYAIWINQPTNSAEPHAIGVLGAATNTTQRLIHTYADFGGAIGHVHKLDALEGGYGALKLYALGAEQTRITAFKSFFNEGIGIGKVTDPSFDIEIKQTNTSSVIMLDSGSGADSAIRMREMGVSKWIVGNDGSDADAFKVSRGTAFGSEDWMVVASNGNVTIEEDVVVTMTNAAGGASSFIEWAVNGAQNVDGNWQIGVIGSNLTFRVNVGGTWTNAASFLRP